MCPQRTVVIACLALCHPRLTVVAVGRKVELALRHLRGKFDSTCPVDRFVARQPRRDVELDAAMYQRSMPQFGSLYLLEQEGFTADRIVGAVKCGDLLQEILPLAAAKATVGGEGPFHCVGHDELPLSRSFCRYSSRSSKTSQSSGDATSWAL